MYNPFLVIQMNDEASEKNMALFIMAFNSARDEILVRIRLRDTVLFTYLSVVVFIIGYAVKESEDMLVLIIPWFTLAASVVFFHHDAAVKRIGLFLSSELLNSYSINAMHWDISDTLRKYKEDYDHVRTYSGFALLLMPAILSLAIFYYLHCSSLIEFINMAFETANYIFSYGMPRDGESANCALYSAGILAIAADIYLHRYHTRKNKLIG